MQRSVREMLARQQEPEQARKLVVKMAMREYDEAIRGREERYRDLTALMNLGGMRYLG